MSALPFAVNCSGAGRARSKNQRSTEFCESPKMKYGLRAPVGTCDGIWIATASENSDAGAAGVGRGRGCDGAALGGGEIAAGPAAPLVVLLAAQQVKAAGEGRCLRSPTSRGPPPAPAPRGTSGVGGFLDAGARMAQPSDC